MQCSDFVRKGRLPTMFKQRINRIAQSGGTPLVVADTEKVLGVIHLKDIVKGGIERPV